MDNFHAKRSIDNFLADARLCSELWFVYLIWHWILVFGTNPRLHFGEPYVDVQLDLLRDNFAFCSGEVLTLFIVR